MCRNDCQKQVKSDSYEQKGKVILQITGLTFCVSQAGRLKAES